MERSALQQLIEWNNNERRKPLIVWGPTSWKNISCQRDIR